MSTARRSLVMEPLADYAPEIAPWIWALEDSRALTLDELHALMQAQLDWRPPTGSNTIGTLLYHIAAIEADWLYAEVLGQDFPPAIVALFPHDVRDAHNRLTEVLGVALAEHLARLAAVRAALLAAFADLTPEAFHQPRSLPDYDVTPAWVLHHLMQHEAEHRGQITLLRDHII